VESLPQSIAALFDPTDRIEFIPCEVIVTVLERIINGWAPEIVTLSRRIEVDAPVMETPY
jgi:hypothetical protein